MSERSESTRLEDHALYLVLSRYEDELRGHQTTFVDEVERRNFVRKLMTDALGRVQTKDHQWLLLKLLKCRLDFDWEQKQAKSWSEYVRDWPELAQCPSAERELQKWKQELEQLDSRKAQEKKCDLPKHEQYEFQQQLGEGSFGNVYKAYDRYNKRLVAVKVSKAVSFAVQAMEAERLALEKVERRQHPHIVRYLESRCPADSTADRLLVFELLEGGTLRDKLRQGPLPVPTAVEYAIQIAEALQCAHDNGLIHRDLKPANILFDHQGVLKVGDFGLAISAVEVLHQRHVNAEAGTLRYKAPEQLRGKRYQLVPQTDIYSLGVILYEMLCGRRPFDLPDKASEPERDLFEKQVLEQAPTTVWKHCVLPPANDELRRELWKICFEALGKEISSRFPSADEMAERLRKLRPLLPTEETRPTVLQVSTEAGSLDQTQPPLTGSLLEPGPSNGIPKPDVNPPTSGSSDDPSPSPQRRSQSWIKRVALTLTLVLLVGGIGVGFWITRSTAKELLASEFAKRQIPLHFTGPAIGENPRLVWPILGRDQQPVITRPPNAVGDGWFTEDLSLLGIPWPPDFTNEFEVPWIALRQQPPIWEFDRSEPSELDRGVPLLVLKPSVFDSRQGTVPNVEAFVEAQLLVRPNLLSENPQFIDLELERVEVALGSPVFVAGSPTTRWSQLLDEHVHHRPTVPQFRLAGFVHEVQSRGPTQTTVRLKSANEILIEADLFPPIPEPGNIHSRPHSGEKLTASGMRQEPNAEQFCDKSKTIEIPAIDRTPPSLKVTGLPRIAKVGDSLTVTVTTESQETLKLLRPAIDAKDLKSAGEPAEGQKGSKFEYHFRPKHAGPLELRLVENSVADLQGNKSTQTQAFRVAVVPPWPKETMKALVDRAQKLCDSPEPATQQKLDALSAFHDEIQQMFAEQPEIAWEVDCLQAAVALETAILAHELANEVAKSKTAEPAKTKKFELLFKEAFRKHTFALARLAACQPENKQVRAQALVESLAARCLINQAILLQRLPNLIAELPANPSKHSGDEYAQAALNKADARIRLSHGRYSNFDAHFKYLEKWVDGVRELWRTGNEPMLPKPPPKPATWTILNEDYPKYWPQ